ADQIFNDRAWDAVAQSGLVDALIKANARRVVLVAAVFGIFSNLGIDISYVDRNIFAGVRERDDSVDRRFAGNNHTHWLQPLAAPDGCHQNAQLLTFLDSSVEPAWSQNTHDGSDVGGDRAEIAQNAGNVFAFFCDDLFFIEGIAAGCLRCR